MGDTHRNEVETRFSSNWREAQVGMGMVGAAASRLGGRLSNLLRVVNPLHIALGALGGGLLVRNIAHLSGEFENTQRTIGGMLGALGAVDGATPLERYRASLSVSEDIMNRIIRDAARLPGSVEAYLQVFQTTAPQLQQALGGNIDEMLRFSNQMTAVGSTFGIHAQTVANDLERMLLPGRGQANMMVHSFRSLLPFMQSVEGHANLTHESFNRMSQTARADLLKQTFEQLQPMLDDATNSFDSLTGSLKATWDNIQRAAGRPLFEGLKEGLRAVNDLFVDHEGNWTELSQTIITVGHNISTFVVDGVRAAVEWGRALYSWFERLSQSPLFAVMDRVASRLMGAAQNLMERQGLSGAAGVAGGAGLVATAGAGAMTGPAGVMAAMAAMGISSFLTNTEAVSATIENFGAIIDTVSKLVSPLLNLFGSVSNMLGSLVAGILPGLLAGINAILGPLTSFYAWFMVIVDEVLTELQPALHGLWEALGNLMEQVGRVVGPLIRILGTGLMFLYQTIMQNVAPVFSALVRVVTWAIEGFTALLEWIGNLLGSAVDAMQMRDQDLPGHQAERQEEQGIFAGILAALTRSNESAAGDAAAAASGAARAPTPHARGGSRTTQDFRYSRFEISQKFAEGFDPDRIAIAFADDLGRVGEQRLQSGFEPLFAIR